MNNAERTGDRDLNFSAMMRLPRGVKVCDYDPMPIGKDGLPIVVWEVKRKTGSRSWILAHTAYVRALGKMLNRCAYFLYHRKDDSVRVTRLHDFAAINMTKTQFVNWIERLGERDAKKS